ncbi:MarR family transcriptional regulator [Streptomyces sp. NPDC096354]|uniref:MarR family transcriptional regulator n=1 Tax=Streptomyces sp. NPDC096354 TaxID=3366088 RepID=UPI003802FD64
MVHDPSFRRPHTGQQNALAHVVLVPGISTAELARRSGVTPQSMGAAVNGLIQRGLLERRPHLSVYDLICPAAYELTCPLCSVSSADLRG